MGNIIQKTGKIIPISASEGTGFKRQKLWLGSPNSFYKTPPGGSNAKILVEDGRVIIKNPRGYETIFSIQDFYKNLGNSNCDGLFTKQFILNFGQSLEIKKKEIRVVVPLEKLPKNAYPENAYGGNPRHQRITTHDITKVPKYTGIGLQFISEGAQSVTGFLAVLVNATVETAIIAYVVANGILRPKGTTPILRPNASVSAGTTLNLNEIQFVSINQGEITSYGFENGRPYKVSFEVPESTK